MEIAIVGIKTTIGVFVLAVGMAGYLFRPMSLAEQIVFALSGVIIMVVPFGQGFSMPLIGAAAALTVVLGWVQKRQNHLLSRQET
jgi:TRAP-type uncharacterized transport system fused permease subunit